MKKLTSLEDTATITITGRDAVQLYSLLGRTNGHNSHNSGAWFRVKEILPDEFTKLVVTLPLIDYYKIEKEQERKAFPKPSKKDLMLKELQSKMDALQCEIDKIKGEKF